MSTRQRVLLLAPSRFEAPSAAAGAIQFHRCSDTADLLGRAIAGAADAAVVVPDTAGLDASLILRLREQGCRVIGLLTEAGDLDLARRIGIAEHIAAPLDLSVLASVLRSPPRRGEIAAPSERRGRIIGVWGPPGSPGRTTVAGLLAIGAVKSGASAVLVDADLAAPHWSLLTAPPAAAGGLAAALRRAGHGSPDVSDLLVEQAPGLHVLPSAPDPARWVEASPVVLPAVLGALAEQFDAVVMDLGSDIRQAHPAYDIGWAHDSGALARTALAASDAVLAVLSAEPVGVHRFAAWWAVLKEQAPSPTVVANKVGAPRSGRRPDEQIATVLAALGCDGERVDLPWDPKSAAGLSGTSWPAARGWRDAPLRLWRSARHEARSTAIGA